MNRAVFVTGCSSGIGQACAVRLSRAGFRVFAGIRCSPNSVDLPEDVTPVEVDVTSTESVAAASEVIAEALVGNPLWGVVNNAGISIAGPLEAIDLADVSKVLETNLLGPLRIVQTFLPMLRASRGRIVNIGSGEAFLATPLNGPYCMSKHAMEALSESLRLELASSGVFVSVVEPGQTQTAILEKAAGQFSEMEGRLDAARRDFYGPSIRARGAMSERTGMPPDRIAAAVERALSDSNPKPRYFVGLDVRGAALLGRFVPSRLRDLFFCKVLGFPGRALR